MTAGDSLDAFDYETLKAELERRDAGITWRAREIKVYEKTSWIYFPIPLKYTML